jgi:hypothetical protein
MKIHTVIGTPASQKKCILSKGKKKSETVIVLNTVANLGTGIFSLADVPSHLAISLPTCYSFGS